MLGLGCRLAHLFNEQFRGSDCSIKLLDLNLGLSNDLLPFFPELSDVGFELFFGHIGKA